MLDESVFRDATLCVVGNVNRDIKTAPLAPGEHLFRDGETSVRGFRETLGGGAANSAAIAAGLGARVALIGQVGGDAIGRRVREALARLGVDCRLRVAAELRTGTTVNLVFDTGQRHFLSYHPNNAALCFDALDLAPLAATGHLLRADLWFSDAMLHEGNERLFAKARELGVPVSIDLNWDPQWGRASAEEISRRKETVRRLLPSVALAHGNARELMEFAGAEDLPAALRRLESWGVGAVVIHLGAQGAGYYTRGDLITEAAVPVHAPQAATGTGDVLSVCLMLLDRRTDIPPRDKLRLANAIVADFMAGRRKFIPELNEMQRTVH